MPFRADRQIAVLWPALRLTASSREGEPYSALVTILLGWLTSFRLMDDEAGAPQGLQAFASFQEVTKWLHSLWLRLSAAEVSEIHAHKKAVTTEILNSSLRLREQANLLTALDYLARLAAARGVADVEGRTENVSLPPTRHPDMQAVYRKLAGFAATDLPIWLAGERGTELEELARLVHRLRGLPDESFHVWEHDAPARSADRWSKPRIVVHDGRPGEATVFVPAIDTAPASVHRQLYDHVVKDFAKPGLVSFVIGTGRVELEDSKHSNLLVELFSFLAPTCVRVMPLRNRRDDLPGLMRYFAHQMDLSDPVPRMTSETISLLKRYHWPGNTRELKWVTGFVIKKRPAGDIRPQDLPETVRPGWNSPTGLTSVLRDLGEKHRFRALASEEHCRALAHFLRDQRTARFTASDIQRHFPMGRETARRLLQTLEARGLIIGLKGAGERRITGYRCAETLFDVISVAETSP